MHSRALAWSLALVFVFAACGRSPDAQSDRVVASPLPSASVDPVATDDAASPSPTNRSTRTAAPGSVTRETSPPTPAPTGNLAAARIKLTRLAELDGDPVAFAMRPGDSAFYIAERHHGQVHRVRGSTVSAPILDISDEISTQYEQGLLGLAFSPDGDKLYINFTTNDEPIPDRGGCGAGDGAGTTVIREYDFDGTPSSPRDVLRIRQPYANHNGGHLAFGRDGYLYIGMGDGGSGGDPDGNAQDTTCLLGKMLRIDPDPPSGSEDGPDCGDGDYTVPSSNPNFACREIWARGLRNPWRFSFDRTSGALWIGDVGQSAYEEINAARGNSDGGENYGWPAMEGTEGTPPANHHAPIYQYTHEGGNCSVTGGYVYRGSRIPALRGSYLFADHCPGRLRAFVNSGGRAVGHRFLGPQLERLTSFGQDHNGELYVISLNGGLYRIDPA